MGGGFPVYCLLIIYILNMFRFNVKSFSTCQAISKSNCGFSACVFICNKCTGDDNTYQPPGVFWQLVSKYLQNSSYLLQSDWIQMWWSKTLHHSTSLSSTSLPEKSVSCFNMQKQEREAKFRTVWSHLPLTVPIWHLYEGMMTDGSPVYRGNDFFWSCTCQNSLYFHFNSADRRYIYK